MYIYIYICIHIYTYIHTTCAPFGVMIVMIIIGRYMISIIVITSSIITTMFIIDICIIIIIIIMFMSMKCLCLCVVRGTLMIARWATNSCLPGCSTRWQGGEAVRVSSASAI